MDQEKNKRTREYDDVEGKIWNKKSKKRDKNNEVEEKGYLAFGVFDFPWLKEGVICKSEECLMDFEDSFLSLLQNQDNGCFKVSSGFEFFDECEDPKTTMDDVWLPFEINGLEPQAEDLDCIWSSLLND